MKKWETIIISKVFKKIQSNKFRLTTYSSLEIYSQTIKL